MEESSDALMETDVSSTTADVPEMQEVTGSHNTVEMVIVVEKLEDEEVQSSSSETELKKQDKCHLDDKVSDKSEPQQCVSTLSSQKDVESNKNQETKEIQSQKLIVRSPNKDTQAQKSVQKSPIKQASPQMLIEKDTQPNSTDHSLTNTTKENHAKNTADSSSKAEPEPVGCDINKTRNNESKADNLAEKSHANEDSHEPECIKALSPIKVVSINENVKVTSNTENVDSEKQEQITAVDVVNIDVTIEKDVSNDSQQETNSDASEKDHNKSISRELRSLINSAKESKIISECTQLTTKTRKSRSTMEANTSLNASLEADKIQGNRRNSSNSQKSNCSEKSEKTTTKRSMRSQNPEFVNKVKLFLNSVTGKVSKAEPEGGHMIEEQPAENDKQKEEVNDSISSLPKKRKIVEEQVKEKNKLRTDPYCWRCHWAVEPVNEKTPAPECTVCPRSFHYKCLSLIERSKLHTKTNWVCPECMSVLHAESSETRSPAMKKISLGMLCELLKYALERMKEVNGVEPFLQPVDRATFPDYDKYVVHPMDLTLMRDHIAEGLYGSTEAFLADAQWILHNSIIFNTMQTKLTAGARALVRSCRAEVSEIEACPECYAASRVARRPTWFTDVCSSPHVLLWAKLKGFPYWPAKAMSVSNMGLVDVRFFGAHDRAWVPGKDCFLYSEKDPNNFRTKRQDIIDSMKEAEHHIRNLSRKYGKFVYPPFKTQFDPSKLNEQLQMMIPSFEGEVRAPVKDKVNSSPREAKGQNRSYSKSSKGSHNDGDVSEGEDKSALTSRKMSDGADIPMEEDDSTLVDKDKTMEIIVPHSKENESASRKRRRSELEEAVMTVIDSGEKRRRLDDGKAPEEPAKTEENKMDTEVIPNIKDKDKPIDTDKSIDTNKSGDTDKPIDTDKSADTDKPIDTDKSADTDKPIDTDKSADTDKSFDTEKSADTEQSTVADPVKIDGKICEKTASKNVTPKSYSPKTALTPKSRSFIIVKTKINKETPKSSNETSKGNKDSSTKTNKETPKSSKDTRSGRLTPKVLNSAKEVSESPASRTKSMSRESSFIKENDKSITDDKPKSRRSSKTNKALNSNLAKSDSSSSVENTSKEKTKENDKDSSVDRSAKANSLNSNSGKERQRIDDNTSLAEIARVVAKNNVVVNAVPGLPTISSVRSLSGTPPAPPAPPPAAATTRSAAKTIEITIEANSDSSIFTPTSTSNVKSAQEANTKLQRIKHFDQSKVGKVGVRAFARMGNSPDKQPPKAKANERVEVEIKTEPIDVDDADRQMEKLDLMSAFKLRPVNPPVLPSLRDVRINKVSPVVVQAKKAAAKPAEVRTRAKKTFPQPKKADEGRSELNGKNSMVYIPIQPPMTQAPQRGAKPPPHASPAPAVSSAPAITRLTAPVVVTNSNSNANTSASQSASGVSCAPPQVSMPPLMSAAPAPAPPAPTSAPTNAPTSVPTNAPTSVSSSAPTIGPATVHTVPLITSLNGQWTFSLQPVMSVGGVDGAASPPMVNGMPDRSALLVPSSAVGLSPVVPPMQPPGAPAAPVAPLATTLQSNALNNAIMTQAMINNTPGEPPRLTQRPLLNPLDPRTPVGAVPPPSAAGPLTAKLNQNAVKLTDFFRTLLEDSIEKLDDPAAQAAALRLQLEQARWRQQQELTELKHTHELMLAEMTSTFEKEKARAVGDVRRAAQVELEAAVKHAKSKQWCANCSKEAQFYCCWNTSYCDYPCQREHWAQHFAVCTQQRQNDGNDGSRNPSENRLQHPPENLQKATTAPSLTVGGKVATQPRALAQDQSPQSKASIIVSMVEDTSGNQTMKCVGTYKSHAPPAAAFNKQLVGTDEGTGKKVVTSGGYLIVGSSSASSTAVVTQPRRAPAAGVRYFT